MQNYGGLSQPDSYEIVILPVPFELTSTYIKGSQKGPAALIEASCNMELYDIETQSEVYQKGIFTEKPIKAYSSEALLEALYKRTKELLKREKFVVTLGGEHTISYSSIRAHAEHHGSLTILQLDAHADLQPAYQNNPWSHASVMARVKEIPQVAKIVSVGIRSLASEELPFLDRENTFFAHELHGSWMDRVAEKLTGPVYLTFDLDAFDSSLMPSTGTPEPGGLDWNQATTLLKRLAKQIVGFDIMELCPQPGNPAPDYVAAKLLYKLLSYKFGQI
ncbi:MAG: agmatinase [Parachlamydia sp.]|nr:agmatinase [Parachlamydia sp.]